MANVTVVGSINMDMVTTSTVFPKQGETVKGESFMTLPGGKGANQAVAAARLGAQVKMLGKVGDDAFGQMLLEGLKNEGIDVSNVEPVTGCASGIASILLTDQDNRIIITAGANDYVSEEYVTRFEDILADSDVVVLQLEIPLETVKRVLTICKQHETKVILNPAPAQQLSDEMMTLATYITPNETEYEMLFQGQNIPLKDKLIVTEGKAGVSWYESGVRQHIEGHQVEVVDTTGAGDTFNGALAASLASGFHLSESISYANAAAAVSVQSLGAQKGMPTDSQVKQQLRYKKESV